mgnify:CR=1 FL=1
MKTRYVVQHSSDNKTWYDVFLEDAPESFNSRREAVDVMNELASHDDHQGWMRVVPTCEFYIVQVKRYLGTDKPRKFRWEEVQRYEVDEDPYLDTHDLLKHFSTREQAERTAKKFCKPKHYRIVRCEVVT